MKETFVGPERQRVADEQGTGRRGRNRAVEIGINEQHECIGYHHLGGREWDLLLEPSRGTECVLLGVTGDRHSQARRPQGIDLSDDIIFLVEVNDVREVVVDGGGPVHLVEAQMAGKAFSQSVNIRNVPGGEERFLRCPSTWRCTAAP